MHGAGGVASLRDTGSLRNTVFAGGGWSLSGWWRAGEFDAALAEVVALEAGTVRGGEHMAGDVGPPAHDRGFSERDDRHPVVRAERGGGLREACHAPDSDVQVGDVLERLVC